MGTGSESSSCQSPFVLTPLSVLSMKTAVIAAWHRYRDLRWAVAIGLVGLVLRVACAQQYAADALGRFPWIDEQAYWARARAILGGRVLPDRPFYEKLIIMARI